MGSDKFHDSAGVPWQGREFQSNSWASDDGSAPDELASALSQVPLNKAHLVEVVSRNRLLIPLLATVGEAELGPHGLLVEKSADLGIVAVATPDGKTAIPAFSCTKELTLWSSSARPVPTLAAKIALAAASEGHERVVIDPAGARVALRKTWLPAIAQGLAWLPPHLNPRVLELILAAAKGQQVISGVELLDGDPKGTLEGAELLIQVALQPGLDSGQLQNMLAVFSAELQSQEFLALVDSISLRLIPA